MMKRTDSDEVTLAVAPEDEAGADVSKPSAERVYPSLLQQLPISFVVGGTVAFAAHALGGLARDSPYYWASLFSVATALEQVSPACNNMMQYLVPMALATSALCEGQGPSSWLQGLMMLPTILFLIGVPMSVCLHRYFSHAAFTTTRFGQFLVATTACMAYQGGPLWWSAKHIRHHHFCDQPQDPHSAVQQGIIYAFFGWTMNPVNLIQRDEKFNIPGQVLPEIQFLDHHYLLPPALLFSALQVSVGYNFILWSLLVPMFWCRIITLLFNVEYHPLHDTKRCKSVDNPRLLALIVGESQHDLHHKSPAKSRRNDWDLPYWMTLYWMEKAGMVWNCR